MFIPKKILYAVGVIAMLAIGISVGWVARSDETPRAPLYLGKAERSGQSAAVVDTRVETPVPRQHSNILQNVGMLESGELVKVVRVVDGDTIEVETEGKTERVRYIGIDTPETVDPRKTVQCFGVEASKKNKELVEGKIVRLERDITDRDKYSRLLRYVWLGDTLINEALVEKGFAKSYSYPPDIKYQDRFIAAERQARDNKLGLWTACASTTPTVSVAPTAAASAAAFSASCTIKGNINASGEKIYHLQGCGSYSKTTIDETRGERWFCSESEAQFAGWRRALNCL